MMDKDTTPKEKAEGGAGDAKATGSSAATSTDGSSQKATDVQAEIAKLLGDWESKKKGMDSFFTKKNNEASSIISELKREQAELRKTIESLKSAKGSSFTDKSYSDDDGFDNTGSGTIVKELYEEVKALRGDISKKERAEYYKAAGISTDEAEEIEALVTDNKLPIDKAVKLVRADSEFDSFRKSVLEKLGVKAEKPDTAQGDNETPALKHSEVDDSIRSLREQMGM